MTHPLTKFLTTTFDRLLAHPLDAHTADCGYTQIEFVHDCGCRVPGMVQASLAAARNIVDWHQPEILEPQSGSTLTAICKTCGSGEPNEYPTPWPCATISVVATLFREHPGFREEWLA